MEREKKEYKLKKLNDYSYQKEKEGNMNVPLKIFASEKLIDSMKEDDCIEQGSNVACLPGIRGFSLMMPDAHRGYGFSIGGVAAIDINEGCISPGGIGFDINCGVRLLSTNLREDEVRPRIKELLDQLFNKVPSGLGGKSKLQLSQEDMDDVLENGAEFAVRKGYGDKDDLLNCESDGKMDSADPKKVSDKARKRGKSQLGTLGSGNHFLEVQFVEKIYDKEKAKAFGITEEGQVTVMIHCGSRGLGHQVASDYLRKMEDAYPDIMKSLPEKDLIYAPAGSDLANDYFKAMSSAANYAWANRHIIAHYTREAFKNIFTDEVKLKTVYDVAHNIAKIEEHEFEGEKFKAYVHRKGATRAFPPNHPELPEHYRKSGQPIIIPGSMGTSSYLLAGTETAMKQTFGSTAHGAGRLLSRFAAKKKWRGEEIKKELEKVNIFVKAASVSGISEEAPLAYKDVDEVVNVSDKAGIGVLVAKVKPIGVVKG